MQRNRSRLAARRRMLGVAAVVGTAIVAACSENLTPTAVNASRSVARQSAMDKGGQKTNAAQASDAKPAEITGLLRERPLSAPITVTKVISRDGGAISIPGADFQLRIPAGAFDADQMTFSVTALAGSTVAYTFEPHGTVFNVPLLFVQHLGHTSLHGKPGPGELSHLAGAYFPDANLVDPMTGAATITETLPTSIAATWTDNVLTFPIRHFSGYLISTGRR